MVTKPPKKGFPNRPGQAGQPVFKGGFSSTVPLPGSVMGAAMPAGPDANKSALTDAVRSGAVDMEAGNLSRALQKAQSVLRIEPSHGDALHLAGLVEQKLGNYKQAKLLLGLAVKRLPKMALAWGNYGTLLTDMVEVDAAYEAFGEALRLDPKSIVSLIGRAQLHRMTRKLKESMADYEAAIAARPDNPMAYVRACETLIDLGRFRDALENLHKAQNLVNRPQADIYALIAEMNERVADLETALEYANMSLAVDPVHPLALRTKVKSLRRLKRYEEALDAVKNIEIDKFPIMHSGILYAELGQVSDKLNRIDDAYAFFTKMNHANEQRMVEQQFDALYYGSHVELLTKSYSSDFVSKWKPLPAIDLEPGHKYPPAFLVGFPRSGTTLLDSIFDAHPDAIGVEEQPMTRILRDAVSELPGGYPHALEALTEETRQKMRNIYFDAVREQGFEPGEKLIVDKMPLNLINGGLIRRIFPEAKIILALRHPADCVLSCFMQDFSLNSAMVNFHALESSAILYDKVMRLWQLYERILPMNAQRVRYEDLVVDLRGQVEPVLHHLGLEWDEKVNDPASHAKAKGDIRTPSYSQVTEPLYTASRDRWRRYETYLKPYLPLLEPHIKHFGYTV